MTSFKYSDENISAPVAYSSLQTMHSVAEIVLPYYSEEKSRTIIEEIWSRTKEANDKFNRFDKGSPLALVNRTAAEEAVAVDDEMFMVLEMCRVFCSSTDGYFDITANRASRTASKGVKNFELDGARHTVRFSDPTVKLDLGGFAKGYALENACNILRKHDVACALLNFGNSSVCAVGAHPYGEYWPISVEHPYFRGKCAHTFELKDCALSISGKNGRGVEHIIDPATGDHVVRDEMIAVTGPSPMACEVLSTALYVAPREKRSDILARFKGYSASEIYCLTNGTTKTVKVY
ncbi:MAG: FAD:protein FMN transferase [Bacteroidales bacterium]|nr:FAD:protein FMN transferase [Bacteroidales bacterium]